MRWTQETILRTFCIINPETPARTEAATKHFAELGIETELIWGFHGETFGIRSASYLPADDPLLSKRVGEYLSQYNIWTLCNHSPEDHFLVLEDDAEFQTSWKERLSQILRDVPSDFDILYLGSCNCSDKPKEHIKNDIWRVEGPRCLYAYIVAKKAIPTLMGIRQLTGPADVALLDVLPSMKSYVVLPRLVNRRDAPLEP